MNTFSVLPVQYIIHLGVLYRRVARRIFLQKKTLFFTSEYVIYTERQWLSNLFVIVKFVNTYFFRARYFNFDFIRLIFFQFLEINFLTIVNAIYILYVAKIGWKLGCIWCHWELSNFAEIGFAYFSRTSNNIKVNVFNATLQWIVWD